jgi:hypothetical protein
MNMDDDHPIMKAIRARAQSRAADADAVPQTSNDNTHNKQSPSPSDLRRFIDDMRTAPNPALAAEQRRRRQEKLEEIATQLNAGKHVQNRTLETWLDPADYAEIDARWQQQKRMRL